jgi:hypothetical protein
VADNSGYNQGESRALHDVVDLVLACRVVSEGEGQLAIRVHDGRDWIVLWLDPLRRQATVEHAETRLGPVSFPTEAAGRTWDVEFGVLDEQIVVAMNRIELLRQPLVASTHNVEFTTQPFALGTCNLDVTVTDLTILRDVYYLDPSNLGQPWEMQQPLAANEFMALGDNPSLSEDSRQWNDGRLGEDTILGKVLVLAQPNS